MLTAILAMPILALARSMPMVRTKSPIRAFIPAKGCSIADRTFDPAALALSCCTGIGLPGGRWKRTFEVSPARAIFFSFFCDRYAVSARTVEPVFA